VSGDSRNCGDFVMPAIAVKVKAEGDTFYWHLGDFRWMSQQDEDMVAMSPGTKLSKGEYQQRARDVVEAIEAGVFELGHHRVYEMKDAVAAHIDLEGRRTTGSLVMVP